MGKHLSIENLNKIIRRFIRKGSDLSLYAKKQIQKIEDLANGRYMGVINYLIPPRILFTRKPQMLSLSGAGVVQPVKL